MTNKIRVSHEWDQLSPDEKRLVNKVIKSIRNPENSDKKINDIFAEALEEFCATHPTDSRCQELKSNNPIDE